jgi:hypothetical protein
MFADRRQGTDRRKQSLPMPAALDRRKQVDGRRASSRNFQGQPWWLSISYGEEYISESDKALIDQSSDNADTKTNDENQVNR